jgi:dienelactone hydrolase
MNRVRRWALAALAMAAFNAALMPASAASDEVLRTFERGRVVYPVGGSVRGGAIAAEWSSLAALEPGAFKAAIVYLHGCDGLHSLDEKTADLLASRGFLVVMPNSFARLVKPTSCDAAQTRGGAHREVLGWRHEEAALALARLAALPAVDAKPVFLYGFSEGAIAAATYDGEGIRGRVIEAWTCHAGWPEYQGLHAGPGEAVLALTSQNDPWFQEPALRGSCVDAIGPPTLLRKSIVFRPPHPAASHHDLMWNIDARSAVLQFLEQAAMPAR